MIRSFILSTFIFFLNPCIALSTIINIPADYPAIQQGIDASTDGDTVLVQPGTYVENINFNGHNIVLGSLFLTTGDTSYISQTVIDGDSSGSVVTFASGENTDATITGFIIRRGYAQNGGGIECDSGSSPRIKNNSIKHNYADKKGGGIYCGNNSLPLISNNVIDSNYAVQGDPRYGGGGGICCYQASPTIINNRIRFNEAPSGAGIWCFEASPLISMNTITQNLAFYPTLDGGGGGIACWNNTGAHIFDNMVTENNSLNGIGGGIFCANYSNTTIENNDIGFNTANHFGGGGVGIGYYSDCNVINNIVINNSAAAGGGLFLFSFSDAVVKKNIISYNSAQFGGGLYVEHCDLLISYNLLFNNDAHNGQGGGLMGVFTDDSPLIYNNTLINNIASNGGTACVLGGWVGWSFYNNICRGSGSAFVVFDSSIQITYCNIQGGYPGEGNIDCDPGFCDPDSGNFYLDIYSCCVGAGRDSLGYPNPNVNIGALGIGCNLNGICDYVVGDVNWSGGFNGLDVVYSVSYFKGGSPPWFVCECTPGNIWYVCGDVNASCAF